MLPRMSGNICVNANHPSLLMRKFFKMSICGFSGAYDTVDQFLSPQSNFNKMLLKLETTTINWVFYNKCRLLMLGEFMTEQLL